MHLGGEDLGAALAVRLGHVHGDVCVAQHVLGGAAAGPLAGDPDAGADHERVAADLERLAPRGEQAQGQGLGFVRRITERGAGSGANVNR